MSRINRIVRRAPVFTHEGAPARHITPEEQLRRLVLTCMLWESQFYVDGTSISDAIASAVAKVPADVAARIAIEAREEQKLRHAPLWIVRQMAALETHRALVASTLERVIQRADELAEFVALYWKDGRQPLSAQVKKGLAAAFGRFDEYQLAKYNRDGAVKLRDLLFLCHAKPRDEEQAALWRKLVDGTLATPDTWEVNLSAGADKRETFERLIRERKLGALALLRNLRNMRQSGVDRDLVAEALVSTRVDRVLPFRFIAAARAVPEWEDLIEPAMLAVAASQQKLAGRTVLLVDVSGSMDASISARSDMNRIDAACGLAVLLREICDEIVVMTFSDRTVTVPPRRGFALRDAIVQSQPHFSTNLGAAVLAAGRIRSERLIVLTDEQSHDQVPAPASRGYMINVASYQNGVGYGSWTHIDGWSESVVKFITALESKGASDEVLPAPSTAEASVDERPLWKRLLGR
jgi:60 kDa SS-A/Ro ribonucleoprotein